MLRNALIGLITLGVFATAAPAADMVMSHDAMLSACWEQRRPDLQVMDVFLEGAQGPVALLMFSMDRPRPNRVPHAFLEVVVPLDEFGKAHYGAPIPAGLVLPRDTPLWVTAAYHADTLIDGPYFAEMATLGRPGGLVRTEPVALLLGGASAEVLDFDWAPSVNQAHSDGWSAQWAPKEFFPPFGRETQAGEFVGDQWSSLGVRIHAENHVAGKADAAILFDSSNPTGGDGDLVTPGYGPGNTVAEGKLLIVASNVRDENGDGLVDDPNDEAGGGMLRFDFDDPVVVCSLKLIDVDGVEWAESRFYDDGGLRQRLPMASIADNAATRLEMFAERTRRLEVDFTGSGAVAYLELMPCPARVDFDWTTYAAPVGLRAGEILTDQLAPLGLTFRAYRPGDGRDGKAVLFDTRVPTGGDGDLVTPGYGYGNLFPRRHVVIIAENDVDADRDGFIDVPDDSGIGGILSVDFSAPRWLRSAAVLDIDEGEVSWIVLRDQWNRVLGVFPLEPLGDNSYQEVPLDVMDVRRLELHLGGSGALVGLDFCGQLPG